ncbi:MAG: ABC transporter ATP-binding protein/permease [Oscillospiraceae bacterium]|nr:ABC transporter ATP-binding protein/permease [Oscillospiraceae bacterium]
MDARRRQRGRGPMHGGPMMGAEKPKDFKGAIGKLVSYLGAHKWVILVVWALAAASVVFSVVGPKVMGQATDELFNGIMARIAGTGAVDFAAIARILLWLAGLYGLSALTQYLQGFIMTGVTMRVMYKLRQDICAKMHRLPLQYFDKTTHGEVLSRITNDVDSISHSLNQSITQVISSVTAVAGMSAMMFSISWQMTLAALCVIPFTVVCVGLIIGKSQKYFKEQQEYLGHVNGHVEEMYGAHTVVKAFNGEQESAETFRRHNGALYNAAWKSNFLSGLMMPITFFIGNLGYVAVALLGGWLAAGGVITVGSIQAFIQYLRQFNQPIAQLAQISNVLQQTAAASERVFEFLGEAEETPDAADAINADGAKGDCLYAGSAVTFENARFGYDEQKIVIGGFSASIKPGQRVAIVGPTGAGKTTIVKLLMRFYDLNGGAILVNGQNINGYKRDELRSLFGMVLQDTWLFNGTIADNIRYGRLDATDGQVRAAAEAAQADHFIRALPDGYNMVLDEEASNVSQGQKQLLTIARALLADPEILILDEATSNVDTRTEALIQKAMENLMAGRTNFIIAHRLSTIRDADLIIVMDGGDIVEQGTHKELMERGGFYAALHNSQFETAG